MKPVNQERVLYASAARTATPAGASGSSGTDAVLVVTNDFHVAAHFVIVTSAVTSTPSTVPTVQGLDDAGNTYDILVGAAIATTGTVVLKVGPGIGAIANGAAADYLPRRFRLLMTHGNANSHTYKVAVQMLGPSGG